MVIQDMSLKKMKDKESHYCNTLSQETKRGTYLTWHREQSMMQCFFFFFLIKEILVLRRKTITANPLQYRIDLHYQREQNTRGLHKKKKYPQKESLRHQLEKVCEATLSSLLIQWNSQVGWDSKHPSIAEKQLRIRHGASSKLTHKASMHNFESLSRQMESKTRLVAT